MEVLEMFFFLLELGRNRTNIFYLDKIDLYLIKLLILYFIPLYSDEISWIRISTRYVENN